MNRSVGISVLAYIKTSLTSLALIMKRCCSQVGPRVYGYIYNGTVTDVEVRDEGRD